MSYITCKNIPTQNLDFNSLIGKFVCFRSRGPETLKMTGGTFKTNCNHVYKVLRQTDKFIFTEDHFSNGMTYSTRFRKDTFEKDFFNGCYVICDSYPVWDTTLDSYVIERPNYSFNTTTDLSKPFDVDEINNMLTDEFLGTTKTYSDVQECIETLMDMIMSRHFGYHTIKRSYFHDTNTLRIGINIHTGNKNLDSFGSIVVKSYNKTINYIHFEPDGWIDRINGFSGYKFSTLEDIILKYLNDNKSYIDTL